MQFDYSKYAVRFIEVASLTDQSVPGVARACGGVFCGGGGCIEWDTWRIAWRINLAWDEHTQSTYYDAMICMNGVHVSMNEIN